MPRAKKLSASQQKTAQNGAKKTHKTTTTAANLERYNELLKATTEAWNVYNELVSEYRRIFPVETAASTLSTLEDELQKAGLTSEASIAAGLSAILKRHVQQARLLQLRPAVEARENYQKTMEAFHAEFPSK